MTGFAVFDPIALGAALAVAAAMLTLAALTPHLGVLTGTAVMRWARRG